MNGAHANRPCACKMTPRRFVNKCATIRNAANKHARDVPHALAVQTHMQHIFQTRSCTLLRTPADKRPSSNMSNIASAHWIKMLLNARHQSTAKRSASVLLSLICFHLLFPKLFLCIRLYSTTPSPTFRRPTFLLRQPSAHVSSVHPHEVYLVSAIDKFTTLCASTHNVHYISIPL